MILKEFFSKPMELSGNNKDGDKIKEINKDDLFWYVLDHDKLHKDYFFPIAQQVKQRDGCSPEEVLELYMPMVKKGCKEYYSYKKMNGNLAKLFPKDLRDEICHRLHDHYFDDIKNEKYNLGN